MQIGAVNQARSSTRLPCANGAVCSGNVIHEVSSLSIDAADPDRSRLMKVFAHSYIVTGGTTLHYDWGHISLFTAPGLAGPWAETPLLGWAGASRFSTAGVQQKLTQDHMHTHPTTT